tara:strand:+ start:712 stop:939 length:228 start_codon:yes stop_codon:yes gene_type:complete
LPNYPKAVVELPGRALCVLVSLVVFAVPAFFVGVVKKHRESKRMVVSIQFCEPPARMALSAEPKPIVKGKYLLVG